MKKDIFLAKKRTILFNERKLKTQKLKLSLAITKRKLNKFNKAKDKLSLLQNELDQKEASIERDMTFLKDKLEGLSKERSLIKKGKLDLRKSIAKLNNSIKKEEKKIRE